VFPADGCHGVRATQKMIAGDRERR